MKPAQLLSFSVIGLWVLAARAEPPSGPADGPSTFTLAVQAKVEEDMNWSDRRDFALADRGFLGTRADPLIRDAAGQPVWDLSAFDFLKAEAPPTVNPSLWRQSQLLSRHGLFEVGPHVWQVRGFDLANMTFVKGRTGWIIIDTLSSTETARAALELATEKLGHRPVKAIIYTHPHLDHFGGAAGLIAADAARRGEVEIIGPKGFLAAATNEFVTAGPAMLRRRTYQFGILLPRDARGYVSSGIGMGPADGTSSLIPPTREIDHTGETLVIDGVRMVFQLTPGTEAATEMNIDFPDWRVVDLAENANTTQHNILTPRGAVVRDAKAWADHLTESIDLFGDSDVLITSHGWPRFGKAEINDYLQKHRDAYAFLHDQTVRLMNQGLTGDEIAGRLKLPAALEKEWYDRPYYGSVSFNSRAVYQYYMGWYDGNPAHLAPFSPAERGARYVSAMGGADKVVALAQAAFDRGDYAWAAELLNQAVMADGRDATARRLLARCYEELAWQSEDSLWRNMYLTGASDLRASSVQVAPRRPPASKAGILEGITTPMLFDLVAVRLDADKVGAAKLKLAFVFPDRKEWTYVTIENGVLIHRPIAAPGPVDATVTMDRAAFIATFIAGASSSVHVDGDAAAFARFQSWIEAPKPGFPIVTR